MWAVPSADWKVLPRAEQKAASMGLTTAGTRAAMMVAWWVGWTVARTAVKWVDAKAGRMVESWGTRLALLLESPSGNKWELLWDA